MLLQCKLVSVSVDNRNFVNCCYCTDLPETCLPSCGHILDFSDTNRAYLWVTDVQIGNVQLHLTHESATNALHRGMVDTALYKHSESVGKMSDDVYDRGFRIRERNTKPGNGKKCLVIDLYVYRT